MAWKSRNNPDTAMCYPPKYFFCLNLVKLENTCKKAHAKIHSPRPQYTELEQTAAVLHK